MLRDRLWFFGSEKYLIQNQGFTGVSDVRKEVRGHEAYGKVRAPGTTRLRPVV